MNTKHQTHRILLNLKKETHQIPVDLKRATHRIALDTRKSTHFIPVDFKKATHRIPVDLQKATHRMPVAPHSAVRTHPPLDLSRARCGERLKIVSMKSNSPACQRLRELGFCEMMEVCKVSDNGALICNLLGCRVAIARDLGAQILVEPVRA